MVHRCLMESLLDQAGIFPSIAEKLCGLMNDIRQHKEEHGLAVGSQSFFHVGKEAALELLELVGVHRVDLTHLIEVENAGGNCRFSLHAGLEQLSAAMIDSEEIEVKAGVSLNAFVAREEKGFFLTDVQEKELDLARIQEMPGIVGYLVQEGDTLWDIARSCLTTPEKIREWNHLETEEAMPGTRLIILKNIPVQRS